MTGLSGFSSLSDMVNVDGKVVVIEEVFEKGKKMIFLFDYGDDWQFLLTCTDVEPAKNKRKVRKVISEKGTPPEQYPDYDE